MNAIVVEYPATIKAEIRSFAHLAHTLSRISVQRAQWAAEARRQGKLEVARQLEDHAAQKRRDANWYLGKAMDRKDTRYA